MKMLSIFRKITRISTFVQLWITEQCARHTNGGGEYAVGGWLCLETQSTQEFRATHIHEPNVEGLPHAQHGEKIYEEAKASTWKHHDGRNHIHAFTAGVLDLAKYLAHDKTKILRCLNLITNGRGWRGERDKANQLETKKRLFYILEYMLKP